MTRDEVSAALSAIAQALNRRLVVAHAIIGERQVVVATYQRTVFLPGDSHKSESPKPGE